MKKLWNVAGDIMPDMATPRPPQLIQHEGPMLACICLGAGFGEANHNFFWAMFWCLTGLALFAQDIIRRTKDGGGCL